jgi:hypothetical protein
VSSNSLRHNAKPDWIRVVYFSWVSAKNAA